MQTGGEFSSNYLLLWRDPGFGSSQCWLVTSLSPLQDRNCLLPFSVSPILSHFPKRPPQLKHHLHLFIYLFVCLGYLFVISLVSDFLSNCPTHELCVYTKTWWCCERQRVSITSLTLSKDVFLGRLQAGRCWQGQQPLLQLSGDPGARGAGGGWRALVGVSGMEVVAVSWKDSSALCCGGCLDMLLCWNSPQHSHGWHLPSIPTCHSYSHWVLPPRQVEMTFGSINQETN